MAERPEPARWLGAMLVEACGKAYPTLEAFAACVAEGNPDLVRTLIDQAERAPTGSSESEQLADLIRRAERSGEVFCAGTMLVGFLRACQHCFLRAPVQLPDRELVLNELARHLSRIELAVQRARDALKGTGLEDDVEI